MNVVLMGVLVWVALDAIIVWTLWSWSGRRHADGDRHPREAGTVSPTWSTSDDGAPAPRRLRLLSDPPTSAPDRGRPAIPHR